MGDEQRIVYQGQEMKFAALSASKNSKRTPQSIWKNSTNNPSAMASPSSQHPVHSQNLEADFDAMLRSAKVAIPLHGPFQMEVWGRIAAARDATLAARFTRWMQGFSDHFERPVAATAALLIMTAGGAWLGSRAEQSAPYGKLAYVQSVSPFAQPHSTTHK